MKHIRKYNRRLFENYQAYDVEGLDEFIEQIRRAHPDRQGIIDDVKSFIQRSGCPKIRFEMIPSGTLGISKTDECIVDSGILKSSIERILYVVLHEVAHQYQYRKHGKNLALELYKGEIPIEEAAAELLQIEQTADRLAIKTANRILGSHGIELKRPLSGYYLNLNNPKSLEGHLEKLRRAVKEKGYTTIEEINDHLYNEIKKVVIKEPRRQEPVRSRHDHPDQDTIDMILDKIGMYGLGSLSDEERRFLDNSY